MATNMKFSHKNLFAVAMCIVAAIHYNRNVS